MKTKKNIEESRVILKTKMNSQHTPRSNYGGSGSHDIAKLDQLLPEVIRNQATINIGTIGHVAHGKSTVVRALSGVHTVRFKKELERNITIKLGYANAKIYKSNDNKCNRPMCYTSNGSNKEDVLIKNGFQFNLVRHVSFVDCPGHDILMSTMLSGAAVMDAAILFIAADEPCPQPQTEEHLAAMEIMQLKNIIILQNKIDLVKKEDAIKQHSDIKRFIKGTIAESAPIIPVSAQLKYNMDVLCEYITKIPIPIRDFSSDPQLTIIRSFDVNKPGSCLEDVKGGVVGGSITKGILKIGQKIEIRPGLIVTDSNGSLRCEPIYSEVVSLFAEQNKLSCAVSGGLIAIGTKIDPTLCKSDRMVGQVLGSVGQLPGTYNVIEISYQLLRKCFGTKQRNDSNENKIRKLCVNENLMVNIGSQATSGIVKALKEDLAKITLGKPVCTDLEVKISLSRRIENHWRLIGWGKIRKLQFCS